MASRPYFTLTGDQLRNIYVENTKDATVLASLLAELSYRTTPKMRALNDEVKKAVERLGSRESGIPNGAPESSSERMPTSVTPSSLPTTDHRRHRAVQRSIPSTTPEYEPDQDATEHRFTQLHTATIRKRGPLTDVPQKRVFPKKDDIRLDLKEDASRITRYGAALKALITEMKKKGTASKQVLLENGRRIQLDGSESGYQFPYDGDSELFEGAAVTATIGSTQSEGKIIAILGNSILVSLNDDFGPGIAVCLLRVDNTAMLEALRVRLEKIENGEVTNFNTNLAESVVLNVGDADTPAYVAQSTLGRLDPSQRDAVRFMLGNSVSYLWGPPGTGKTETLSVLCLALVEEKQRILLCSNTNQAVDQVLLKLCEKFGKEHPAIADGRVIRIGAIAHDALKKNWSEYVTLDGVAERKSASLVTRKIELEVELKRLNADFARAAELMRAFVALDGLLADSERIGTYLRELEATLKKLVDEKQTLESRRRDLIAEKARVESSGVIAGLFMRSPALVEKDISHTNESLAKLTPRMSATENDLRKQHQGVAEVNNALQMARQSLARFDRKAIQNQLDDVDRRRKPLLEEISAINKQLDDIRKAIVDQAQIVGATVTKGYLSPQMFSGFDVVIVDEASMVLLPAVFHAAGLARSKVVISGDFRQLAPIVQTDQYAILELIGNSVFRATEIHTQKPEYCTRVSMLNLQYRMTEEICALINDSMYDGRLKTADAPRIQHAPFPQPFDQKLLIIDTSTIWPFVNRDLFGSRYNLMHGLAIRNICRHLDAKGLLPEIARLGVCTPYAAQAKLVKKILAAEGLSAKVGSGTVHRFQGDEKTAMILDIPDSYGEPTVGVFLEAEQNDEDGSLLFNVAISRAREQLIVLANLAYLDKKLPRYAFLREILSSIQERGAVIDVRDVLALYPIFDDLRTYGKTFDLSVDAAHSGLFNQHDFEKVFEADLERAKRGIAILSGFVTPQRVATYEAIFRRKLAQGVRVRCVTRPPAKNGSIPIEQGKEALDGLERMGCVVDTRGEIHQKLAIIDDEIVWFGSLNPLSYTTNTDETMARMSNKEVCLQISAFLAMDKGIRPDAVDGSVFQAENPRCPNCDSRVSFNKGRYGAYWACEECDWRENHDKAKRRARTPELPPENAPLCDKCGAQMVPRVGRFGSFYGCSEYPKCKNIVNVKGSPKRRNNPPTKTDRKET